MQTKFKSRETSREGEELSEPNGIMESRVCATLRWLRSGKIYSVGAVQIMRSGRGDGAIGR